MLRGDIAAVGDADKTEQISAPSHPTVDCAGGGGFDEKHLLFRQQGRQLANHLAGRNM
jgi:hypothetical protein